MQEIVIGVGLFTCIVLTLTSVILLARYRLVAHGNVTLTVNGKRRIQTPVGRTLSAALAANKLFIPAACGGRGSCGQCRVEVVEGGGAILPTETAHISKRESAAGQRLACQVVVSGNIRIRVPDTVFGIKRQVCTVRSNNSVSTFIKELVLEMPENAMLDFRAGGYVQIECPAHSLTFADFDIPAQYRDEWQRLGFFHLKSKVEESQSRAYSLANYPGESDIVMLNVRIATPPPKSPSGVPPGAVSSYLFNLKPGDPVVVLGPIGNFVAKQTDAEMIFVGGGAGMAPMRSHIFDQLKRVNTRRKMSFWYGARNLQEAFYIDEFDQLANAHSNFRWVLALSEPGNRDHWSGPAGFIHDVLLDNYLADHAEPEECEYYLCGPPMMISAAVHMLHELGVEDDNIIFDDFGI